MNNDKTYEFLREILLERIELAREDCKENSDFPNSYGAGFDHGILRAYIEIFEIFQKKL